MTETVHVQFEVLDRATFDKWLQDSTHNAASPIVGYRSNDFVQRREALVKFVNCMEAKLRKNEHKKNWREKPVEALFKLLLLEIEEFKVSHEFFTVGEAKGELVDVANFAMMVHDRLNLMDQERNAREQQVELDRMRAMQNSVAVLTGGNYKGTVKDWMGS